MGAVLLALAASAAWGASDFFGGLASRGRSAYAVIVVTQAAGIVPLTIAVLIAATGPPPEVWLPAAIAGLGNGFGVLMLYRALAIGPMSVVAPLFPLGVLVPVTVGIASGDRPSWIQGVGVVAAITGCFLASKAPRGGEPVRRAGIVAALLAAAGIGVGITALDAAADHDVLWSLEILRISAFVAVLAIALVLLRPARLRADAFPLRPLVLIGLVDVTANAALAWASTLGLISVVSVLSSVYPVVTVLLARAVLKERMQPVQVAGVALAFGGIAALVAG